MPSQNPILLCFPGFLGLPSDFEPFRKLDVDLEVIDICGNEAPKDGETWMQWQQRLLAVLNQKYIGRSVIVLGYSMGARICLGILREKPIWLRSAVLMSCSPGLQLSSEREDRLKSDFNWARRFREEPWDSLIRAWNQQPAFASTKAVNREEGEYYRENLARSLEVFSLGRQELLETSSIAIPSLICWGERDLKFRSLALLLKEAFSQAFLFELPQAGHRVISDNSAYMAEKIRHFINS
jgi:2-succinyl-6-hydroxy-2,4-cyclohexadiene-1-carboxylate synthase